MGFPSNSSVAGFEESCYRLAHYYLKVWAREEKLHAKVIYLKNTLFINTENFGENKQIKKKNPFCLFEGGRLEKTKPRNLNQTQKRSSYFSEKVNKTSGIYLGYGVH